MIRAYGQKPMRQLRFPPSAVVAVHELAEVFLKLGQGHSSERAEQESLSISRKNAPIVSTSGANH